MLASPRRARWDIRKGPAGLEPPAVARIRKKNEKSKKGERVFVLQDQNTGEYHFIYMVDGLLRLG